MELTCSKVEKIFHLEFIPTTSIGYTLLLGIHDISDIGLMLNSSLPDDVKITITIVDIRI